ncbi:porin [Curvibacter sp. HBC61]|uniref:Porin n=1 Tax=Curvibacter cyanobacteriorum TaxID=3026422 RepID=A0ABT5MXI1_9BURK|nr:porin [Curvibacter sp. HBC61]MDD0838610.1 porin [Curvibacter sp. HBC61]
MVWPPCLRPLALAALSPLVGAQALPPPQVTVFGVIDLSRETVQTRSGRSTGLSPSGNSSSSLGWRGSENLGAGLSVLIWLEGSVDPSNGSGASGSASHNQALDTPPGPFILNRRTTLSLKDGSGELRLGRDDTPSWKNYGTLDPFNGNGVGAMLPGYTGDAAASTFSRASNAVSYFLPAAATGWYGQAMVASGNQASQATQNGVDTSRNGRYAGARLGFKLPYTDWVLATGRTRYAALTQTLGSNALAGGGTQGGAPVLAGTFIDRSLGVTQQFEGGTFTALLSRQTLQDVGQPGQQQSTRGWGVGLQLPSGRYHLLASLSAVRLDGAQARKWALGAVYDLSQRSALYFSWARLRNTGGASMAASSNSSSGLPAASGPGNVNGPSTGWDLGLRLSF